MLQWCGFPVVAVEDDLTTGYRLSSLRDDGNRDESSFDGTLLSLRDDGGRNEHSGPVSSGWWGGG